MLEGQVSPPFLLFGKKLPLKLRVSFVEKVDVCPNSELVVITRKENSPCMKMNDYL